ncbi:MarR family winged helix-turn-helix transcriptional regulator [Nocardioides rubriscoriae]|uniref:MarR family winged helix-turn-helix transcriptional regulator n=1 Tax=Nocardioides rubriscoriae TaxID=642762 RepID=UPI0011DFF3FC|nr:MarR family transcriptional regulator [Nocardioides rubriscoriae]
MPGATPPPDPGRTETARQVVRALRRYATESDLYVADASRDSEMHRTDLNALALVMDWGMVGETATPGRLSAAMRLSAPATSALLDRLERAGHVTRSPHPDDRRSVVVGVTDHALDVGGRMFGRLAAHLAPVLDQRSDEELALIADFLDQVAAATVAARHDIAAHRDG